MICKKCNVPMHRVISFNKGKQEEYWRCPRCHMESKHTNVQMSYVANIYMRDKD